MPKEVVVREEILITEGVDVEVSGKEVRVRGPRGEVVRDFGFARNVRIAREDDKVVVESYFAKRKQKALTYSIASHIRNMIDGVTKGFRYKLKVIYSHFPVTVKVEGDKVVIENFLGEKAPRVAKIVGNVKVTVTKQDIVVEGVDIEHVGQTAANIERATRIKDLDRRVFVDGIYVYEKGYAEG
ncbi:MAG: 50S ribosomal protein L6 [Desulfurococcales archaeon]|nr:50S ribosomal protein L6 [Desulfurococcales archaeon]